MSRRKQSNPKPLKREDEEWGSDEAEPAPPAEEATAKPEASPSREPTPETPSATEDPTPRLRLNASLATDPALRSPVPEQNPAEYLAGLPPAALLAAGRFFPLLGPLPPEVPRPPSEPALPSADRQTVPVYMCTPCGIRFSSLSTLEAHQTYYCSHRHQKGSSDVEDGKSVGESSQGADEENPAKAQRTGKQYACTHCSYSADKKVSLNRHMRMHSVSPGPSPGPTPPTTNGEPHTDIQDRYCQDCDIRFSSLKTFRAHKMHYCSTRHIVKPTSSSIPPGSSCTSGSGPTSPVESSVCKTPPSPANPPHPTPGQQALLALPTNPILIVPYSLFRGASFLPGPSVVGMPNPDTPCFLLPNGTLQPMSHAITPSTAAAAVQTTETTSKEIVRDPSAPLDLSMRKSPEINDLVIDMGDDESEKPKEVESRVAESPEQIVCAPSLPGSPSLTPSPPPPTNLSISPKGKKHESRSNSPRLTRGTPKSEESPELKATPPLLGVNVSVPATLHPILMRAGPILNPEIALRLAQDLQSPQVLVKQGVSKCKECNIVFYKHENYVAHKKHYCSARLQEDGDGTSRSPPTSPTNSNGKTSPAVSTTQYQQLICMACGIKFASLDNLNAHQMYYCLKRGELQPKLPEVVSRCLKCKAVAEPGHQCGGAGQRAGWKCPCCDVVSLTASGAQRHMETHTGVKAYRCTICKYKGNTLRGMRTHIRMHFEKRTSDLQEEKYITYILDDETVDVSNPSTASAPTPIPEGSLSSPSSEEGGRASDRLHHCDSCSYSSTYKGNVLRHVKLVHHPPGKGENGEEHPSSPPSETGPSPVQKTPKSMPSLDEEEVKVKTEPAVEEIVEVEDVKPPSVGECESEVPQDASRPNYCKSCDIPFTYYSTFVAHKKFYCSSHAGEISGNNSNNNNNNHTPNSRPAAETSVL